MSAETVIALLGAVTALVVALATLFRQMHSLSVKVDGRLTELLDLTRESASLRAVLGEREIRPLRGPPDNDGI